MRYFLLSMAAALVAVSSVYFASQSTSTTFESASELREFAEGHGLYVHAGGTDTNTCYFVADHDIDGDDCSAAASRFNCGHGPEWKGLVWVCQIHSPGHSLCDNLVTGHKRVWGNVLIAGDPAVIDQIERRFQGAPRGQ